MRQKLWVWNIWSSWYIVTDIIYLLQMVQNVCYLRTGRWTWCQLFQLFIWWKVKWFEIYRILWVNFIPALIYYNYQKVQFFSFIIFWNIIYYSLHGLFGIRRYFGLNVCIQFGFSINILLTSIIFWQWFR